MFDVQMNPEDDDISQAPLRLEMYLERNIGSMLRESFEFKRCVYENWPRAAEMKLNSLERMIKHIMKLYNDAERCLNTLNNGGK